MSTSSELTAASLPDDGQNQDPNNQSTINVYIPLGLIALLLVVASLVADSSLLLLGIFGLVAAVPAAYLIWNRPEFALLALVLLESNIVLPDQILDFRLAGGGLDLRDLVLLGTLGLTFFKRLAKGKITIPYFPIGGLLLLFLLLTFISLINSLMFERVAFNWAMNDFRIMLYYTLFFSTAWGIKDRRQLKTLLAGVFILANLVVGLMIVQQFLGIDNLLTSGMSRWQITEEVDGSLRILPPLIFMIAVLASISSAFAFFAEEPRVKFLSAFQALFLVVGLLLTFTRSAWLTIIMAVLIVIAFAANEKREKVVGSMIFVTPALLIVLSLSLVQSSQRADIPYVGSIFNRVTSIFQTDETVQSDSLQWRVFENSEAMKSIQNRPIFGVGLGNQYREITIAHGEAAGSRTGNDITRLTRYVHNSILSMAVKMGLPTLILFLSTYLLFIYKSWKLYPKTDSSIKKSVVIGVIAIFIPSIFWAQFFTLFTESNHIMSVALFMGVISVISDLTESRSQTNSAVGELN